MWKHSAQGPISSRPSWHSMNEKFTLPNTQTHSTWWIITTAIIWQEDVFHRNHYRDHWVPMQKYSVWFWRSLNQTSAGRSGAIDYFFNGIDLVVELREPVKHVLSVLCWLTEIGSRILTFWRLVNKIDISALWWSTWVITVVLDHSFVLIYQSSCLSLTCQSSMMETSCFPDLVLRSRLDSLRSLLNTLHSIYNYIPLTMILLCLMHTFWYLFSEPMDLRSVKASPSDTDSLKCYLQS